MGSIAFVLMEHGIACIGMVTESRALAVWVVYECKGSPCQVQTSCSAHILRLKAKIVDQTTNACVLNGIHENCDCL